MILNELTLSGATEAIVSGALSPVDLTRAHLDQIAAIDPLINSYITVTAETAMRQARDAEDALERGETPGPLLGIPLAVKDLFETAGVRTTAGSHHLENYVPTHDATVVRRLKEAGAVLLGKLNMHEWAMSVTNRNPFYGDCKNPWDPDRIPGGSSGGSGAALAAGLCLGALGSDTAGSIRIPASLCGVVGLKPTFGRVSTHGALPLSRSMDHAGPMARTVRDVAILLQALAGYDPVDPYSIRVPVDEYTARLGESIGGWRVALLLDGFFPPEREADPEVIRLVRDAADVLSGLGAQVEELRLSGFDSWKVYNRMLLSDALDFHWERFTDQPDRFSGEIREVLERASRYTGVDYARARREQARLKRQLDELFESYDLLLTPSTPAPARRRDGADESDSDAPLTGYTAPFNLAGVPALSVPCGFTSRSLPVGLQLVGPAWSESRILQAGYAYESATSWHARRPSLPENTQYEESAP